MYLCRMVSKSKTNIPVPSFSDTEVIGINSGLADYKLAWHINEKLSIDLARQDDLRQDEGIYPFYYYNAHENDPVYNLVAIAYNDKELLDFSPRLDFLLIIRNEHMQRRIEAIKDKVKEIEGVNYSFLMDTKKGKLQRTLYDIEQHEVSLLRKIREKNTIEYVRKEIRDREALLGLRSASE